MGGDKTLLISFSVLLWVGHFTCLRIICVTCFTIEQGFYPFLKNYSTSATNTLLEAFYRRYLQTVYSVCLLSIRGHCVLYIFNPKYRIQNNYIPKNEGVDPKIKFRCEMHSCSNKVFMKVAKESHHFKVIAQHWQTVLSKGPHFVYQLI